jgi:hypothetical protein
MNKPRNTAPRKVARIASRRTPKTPPQFEVVAYYRGNVPWIAERTILLTKAGSHAYGTNTPDSDLDVRGIVVAPRSHYLGLPPPRKQKPFEQVAVGGKAGKEDDEDEPPDLVIYEARKFLALATECNPNIIEVLWTDPSDFLAITPLGQRLIDARETFLSRRAYPRFSRYAMSQMRRMKGHHAWLTNPPKEPPTRKSMGLPERTLIPKDQLAAAQSAVEKKLARWKLNDMSELSPDARIAVQETLVELVSEMGLTADARWNAAARAVGYNENFIELLDLERQYQSKQTHWREYQGWLRHRNPVRAALEAKYGFDTKHGLHLMRLLRMCREILTLGRVIVKRPDFRDLLDVRDGLWSCEALCDWAMREDAELEILAHTSLLPAEPDRDVINQICIDIIAAAISA